MVNKNQKQQITDELATKLGKKAERVEHELDEYYNWMLSEGKNPQRNKGLSPSVSENYHGRIDQIHRFIIDMMNPGTLTRITPSQADLVVKWLDEDEIAKQSNDPYSESAKRKFVNALEKYFTWRQAKDDGSKQWEPKISFSQSHHESTDKLNFSERWKIREAALEYGSLPSFYETDPSERETINGLVAQRLGKPKDEITRKDWERSDESTKIGSLVATTLETGLTPIEIGHAQVDWFDPQRNIFTIPTEYASKQRPTSALPLIEDTSTVFSKWIKERRHYEVYDGTSLLWLNREGNPYSSKTLCHLIRRLCDQVGIDHENRKIVWYSLRHNVGHSFEEEDSLSQARDQLRHDKIETTKKFYGSSSIESRRHTLEEINKKAERAAMDPSYNPYAADDNESRSPTQKERSEVRAPSHSQTTYINAVITDNSQSRNQLAQDILAGEETEGTDEPPRYPPES